MNLAPSLNPFNLCFTVQSDRRKENTGLNRDMVGGRLVKNADYNRRNSGRVRPEGERRDRTRNPLVVKG